MSRVSTIGISIGRRTFMLLVSSSLLLPIGCQTMSNPGGNVVMEQDTIRQLLERLGEAISVGDLKRVSACWEVPALILLDDSALAFANLEEIEKLMARASESYRSQGIASTKPEIEQIEMLSEKLASVDVRWPSLDATGNEKASERSHYILQFGDNGPRIRVALTRTK
jgi:hypothetical protein